ncbi:PLD nuclease N-terminal domain-containing protein [Pseudomonas sp. DTU_2021_1001937_2_SI_NGA_ILE_001]|uniref:PLD nuclease N-terminal domain-containing protein n=1 Tax=Pseudomonas sp. DTU_2021_1001937_2_SI_NGA_ILE_001 TaxID=3077589 RepID=UPI0028FC0D77|nr:PLD nuclease N-terminal domain-containing protein [Pseudomonas sp. DTU_2021_1001937_2_SI_NGA_ILE_001]WNW10202.1 PLD nuclease N-terminal domain-containing protein [Pseudomonas sp. DTU_2021_1001937_2_SI_NGA_ILE_001]
MDISVFVWGGVLILAALDIWVANSIWRSEQRSASKTGWTLIVFLLPVIGLVIWALMGPRGVAEPPSSDTHSKG